MASRKIKLKDIGTVGTKALTYAVFHTINKSFKEVKDMRTSLGDLRQYNGDYGSVVSDLTYLILRSFNFLNREKDIVEKLTGLNINNTTSFENVNVELRKNLDKIGVYVSYASSNFDDDIKQITKTDLEDLKSTVRMDLDLSNLSEEESKKVLTLFFGGEMSIKLEESDDPNKIANIILEPSVGYDKSKIDSSISHYVKNWAKNSFSKKESLSAIHKELEAILKKSEVESE